MNKIQIIEEKLNNIQFHIDHVNEVMLNPGLYETPKEKTPVDLESYLNDLVSAKSILEQEKEALTNQG